MIQAEQFKLVATILKTAEPGTPDRIWLGNMIKEYQRQYQGEELQSALTELLAYSVARGQVLS